MSSPQSTLQYGLGGERPYGLYYKHSGHTPLASLLLAGALGVVAGVVIAVVYAYTIEYVPFIKLRFVATIGFGALVGAVTAGIAKAGKVRSTAVVLALVGVVTLVAYYFSWVIWLKLVFADAFAERGVDLTVARLASRPLLLADLIRAVYENGTWAISKSDKEATSGVMLGVVWLVEVVAIFGMAFVVAVPMVRSQMFCEQCNRWCGNPATLRQLAPADVPALRRALELHDWAYLATLPAGGPPHYLTLELHGCPACRDLHAVSVRETKQTVDKKGKVTQTQAKLVIDKLVVTRDEAEWLRNPQGQAGPAEPGPDQPLPPLPVTPSDA
jgi:hypothetical protein